MRGPGRILPLILITPIALISQVRIDSRNLESPPVHPIEVFQAGTGNDLPVDLETFAGAFEALLGGSDLGVPDMREFEDFIAAIHPPTEPGLPGGRRSTDRSGDVPETSGRDNGRGSPDERKIDRTVPTAAPGACAHCHAFPAGRHNRTIDAETLTGPAGADNGRRPRSTAKGRPPGA